MLSFLLPRAKTCSGLGQSYRQRVSWDLIFDHYSCCFRVTSSSLTETRLPLHKECWYKKKFLKLNFYLRRPNFALQPRTPPTPGRSVCGSAVTCNLILSTGEKVFFQAPFDTIETKRGELDEGLFIHRESFPELGSYQVHRRISLSAFYNVILSEGSTLCNPPVS